MPLKSFFATKTEEEDWCEQAWLDWRRRLGFDDLTLVDRPSTGPDRIYLGSNGERVAVEITRLLEPRQREKAAFADRFLVTRVFPQVQGKTPGRFAVAINPPWRIEKGRATNVAAQVADWIVASAPMLQPGCSSNLTFDNKDGRVDLTLYALSGRDSRVVLGSLGEGGSMVDDDSDAAKLAGVVRAKLARGQLSSTVAARRVLLVHDRLLISDSAVDAAAGLLVAEELKQLDEITVVRTWEGTTCAPLWPAREASG